MQTHQQCHRGLCFSFKTLHWMTFLSVKATMQQPTKEEPHEKGGLEVGQVGPHKTSQSTSKEVILNAKKMDCGFELSIKFSKIGGLKVKELTNNFQKNVCQSIVFQKIMLFHEPMPSCQQSIAHDSKQNALKFHAACIFGCLMVGCILTTWCVPSFVFCKDKSEAAMIGQGIKFLAFQVVSDTEAKWFGNENCEWRETFAGTVSRSARAAFDQLSQTRKMTVLEMKVFQWLELQANKLLKPLRKELLFQLKCVARIWEDIGVAQKKVWNKWTSDWPGKAQEEKNVMNHEGMVSSQVNSPNTSTFRVWRMQEKDQKKWALSPKQAQNRTSPQVWHCSPISCELWVLDESDTRWTWNFLKKKWAQKNIQLFQNVIKTMNAADMDSDWMNPSETMHATKNHKMWSEECIGERQKIVPLICANKKIIVCVWGVTALGSATKCAVLNCTWTEFSLCVSVFSPPKFKESPPDFAFHDKFVCLVVLFAWSTPHCPPSPPLCNTPTKEILSLSFLWKCHKAPSRSLPVWFLRSMICMHTLHNAGGTWNNCPALRLLVSWTCAKVTPAGGASSSSSWTCPHWPCMHPARECQSVQRKHTKLFCHVGNRSRSHGKHMMISVHCWKNEWNVCWQIVQQSKCKCAIAADLFVFFTTRTKLEEFIQKATIPTAFHTKFNICHFNNFYYHK